MTNNDRPKLIYLLFVIITIVLGLLSRNTIFTLPYYIKTYSGDTLWAMMVYNLISIISPKRAIPFIFLCSMLFAFSIEFSQLYQARWINHIRHTTLGALVLGFGFKTSDLLCYTVGNLLAMGIDAFSLFLLSKKRTNTA